MSGSRERRQARGSLITASLMSLCLAASAMSAEGTRPPAKIAPPKRIPPVLESVPSPRGVPVATAALPRQVRRAVVADAARRFEVAESAVVLSGAEQVTWSDASLGCPQPGLSYARTVVPGYRLSAVTASGRMRYHTDSHGHVVACES